MLLTQLPQSLGTVRHRSMSLSSVSVSAFRCSTASVTRQQSRTFWGWRRGDYASHIDPMFHRLARYRTLKTRAKLLDKARRRGRWDWDAAQRPFFSPKHIRLASHWNGIGRARYPGETKQNPAQKESDADTLDDEGFELSRRELEWKERMEAMRKHIEQDTYEAVFGKRFEPFWNPLLPRWMRSDEGHNTAPKESKSTTFNTTSSQSDNDKPSSKSTKPLENDPAKKETESELIETPNGQLTNYSYSSSTSWDSWTNKARRQEWDSISGQTRHFEYDPISNRMVKVEGPKPKEQKSLQTSEAPRQSKPEVAPAASDAKDAVFDIPVKKSIDLRKAIPVPTQCQDTKPSVYFPSLINTVVPKKAEAHPPISREFEQDLDRLTSDEVRASVGKSKKEANNMDVLLDTYGAERGSKDADQPVKSQWEQAEELVMLERELDKLKLEKRRPDVDTAELRQTPTPLESALQRLKPREPFRESNTDIDDSAAHESTGSQITPGNGYIPKNWEKQADLLQADRVRRTSDKVGSLSRPHIPRWIDEMNARKAEYDLKKSEEKAKNAARDAKLAKVNAMLEEEVEEQKRQMLAHETRAKFKREDEAGELATEKYRRKIADLRKELDLSFRQSSRNAEMQVERIGELEKKLQQSTEHAPSKRDAEQIAKLQSEALKYQQKTASLRKELDESFRQSSVGAEMHMDRIRALEKELESTKTELVSLQKSTGRKDKVNDRIGASGKTDRPDLSQAEGDFCSNITKFAKDSNKWYKRPASSQAAKVETKDNISEGLRQRQMLEQHEKDRALVQQVKSIYEQRFGPIDDELRKAAAGAYPHKPTSKIVDVEAGDVDLGSALGEYESQKEYGFQRMRLGTEIAQQEMAAYESMAERDQWLAEDSAGKSATKDQERRKLAEEVKVSQDPAKQKSSFAAAKTVIEWQDPPVYKVVTYDSGNDMITTAETSSNFTDAEAPISIPQALSQLYQPSRFVTQFAQLQKENFQVIHATNDLLVFKKIKATSDDISALEQAPAAINTDVNPIDGTLARPVPDEPETGRFASPTGFVGDRWDNLASPDGQQTDYTRTFEPPTINKSPNKQNFEENVEQDDVDFKHYPRVRREERVFSGAKPHQQLHSFNRRSRRHHEKWETVGTARGRNERRRRIRWALTVGTGAAATAYLIGAAVERQEKRELERWERIVQGKN